MTSNLFCTNNAAPSTSVVNYAGIHGLTTWSTTETARLQLLPAAFTLSAFGVVLTTAPGVGKSYTFTLRQNQTDTALTLTISDTATSAFDTSHGVAFAAGDLVTVSCTPSGTPAASSPQYFTVQCDSPTTHVAPIVGAQHATTGISTSATTYAQLTGSSAGTLFDLTEANVAMIVPCAGTLDMLYAKADNAPGAGTAWTLALTKNGTISALSAAISGTLTTGNDTTHSVSVAAGDTLSMSATATGVPGFRRLAWAMRFTPTVPGQTFFGYSVAAAPSQTTTGYDGPITAGFGSFSTSEAIRLLSPGKCTIIALYVSIGTAPNTGKSRTFTLRRNNVSMPLSAAISGAAVSANAQGSVGYNQTDFLTLQHAPSGTPDVDTGGVHVGVVMYTPIAAASKKGGFFQMM